MGRGGQARYSPWQLKVNDEQKKGRERPIGTRGNLKDVFFFRERSRELFVAVVGTRGGNRSCVDLRVGRWGNLCCGSEAKCTQNFVILFLFGVSTTIQDNKVQLQVGSICRPNTRSRAYRRLRSRSSVGGPLASLWLFGCESE